MSLLDATHRLYDDLLTAALFSNSGKTGQDDRVVYINDKNQMVELLTGNHWDDLQRNLSNCITTELAFKNGYSFYSATWRAKVNELKPWLIDIRDNMNIPFEEPEIQKEVRLLLCHVVSHRLLESELQEYLTKSYYQELYNWFLIGHLPCGWQGTITFPCMTDEELSSGKLMIY